MNEGLVKITKKEIQAMENKLDQSGERNDLFVFISLILGVFIIAGMRFTTKIKSNGKAMYPSIPFKTIKALYEKCDYVDYSFNNLPFTISRQEPNDLRHSLGQIAQEVALVDSNCSPFGRMIYYKDGEVALEGLIYYSKGCNYFVFLENNQPKYANFMTPSGVQFFNGLLAQLQQTPKQ